MLRIGADDKRPGATVDGEVHGHDSQPMETIGVSNSANRTTPNTTITLYHSLICRTSTASTLPRTFGPVPTESISSVSLWGTTSPSYSAVAMFWQQHETNFKFL